MSSAPVAASASEDSSAHRKRFSNLRSIWWRIALGILPSSPSASIDDLRRVTADTRRRYASLRRRLLIDHHAPKEADASLDLAVDNPLSQNPDSTWGRFFSYAELVKMVNQDLCRLYPELSEYFHSPKCQALLRRILVLWCLQHPQYGYRQGMHELLAPLVYVLRVDLDHLAKVQKLYQDCFSDGFEGISLPEIDLLSNDRIQRVRNWDSGAEIGNNLQKKIKHQSLDELDTNTREIFSLSDSYGAEGELGIILSEKFMEHDAYCMFNNLMDGAQGVVAMASFFSPVAGSITNLPPIIEASSALYHLLSIVDSSLHSHLMELEVEPQYFALRWLRVLFGREFCLDDLLVIWDELLSSSNIRCIDDDVEYNFDVLCCRRGAFVASLAVSMLLYLRSSLLSTETATSCLQRLLNFPQNPDMKKLIEKAISLKVLALESNISVSSSQRYPSSNKPTFSRGCSLPSGSTLSKTPPNLKSDSYWEEKWRVLHTDEELRKQSNSSSSGVMEKLLTKKLSPSRTKSEPLEGKVQSSLRRKLFIDAYKAIEAEKKDHDISEYYEAPGVLKNSDDEKYVPAGSGDQRISSRMVEETLISGDSSLVISSYSSPQEIDNDHETESVESTVTSNSFAGDNDEETINNEEPASQTNAEETIHIEEPASQTNDDKRTDNTDQPCNQNLDIKSAQVAEPTSVAVDTITGQSTTAKNQKPLADKFQWFWKFGRGSNEENQDSHQSSNGHIKEDSLDISTCDGTHNSSGATKRIEVRDKKVMDTLRNLGQSMLENIQVIESVFQQDKGKLDPNNIFGGKGQGKAVAALKELRKISNLLEEM